jgi:hypothetical protein
VANGVAFQRAVAAEVKFVPLMVRFKAALPSVAAVELRPVIVGESEVTGRTIADEIPQPVGSKATPSATRQSISDDSVYRRRGVVNSTPVNAIAPPGPINREAGLFPLELAASAGHRRRGAISRVAAGAFSTDATAWITGKTTVPHCWDERALCI